MSTLPLTVPLWRVSGEDRRVKEHAWGEPQVWQMRRLETPCKNLGSNQSFTYYPSPYPGSPTCPHLPQQYKEKEWRVEGIQSPRVPVGEEFIQPLHQQQSFLRDSPASIHWLSWPPIPTSGDQSSQRTFDLPQSNPQLYFQNLPREGGRRKHQSTATTFPPKQVEEHCELL